MSPDDLKNQERAQFIPTQSAFKSLENNRGTDTQKIEEIINT